MFGPGSESFPESQERPEGTVSVRWQGSEDALPVDVIPNLVYQALSGEEQRIQLFLPMAMPLPGAPAEKRPLVVYVPGSAWHRQNVWMGLDKARYFAARGFAFAIVEYRPSELSPFPAQIEDAGAAVRFLLERFSGVLILDADGLNALATLGPSLLDRAAGSVILRRHIAPVRAVLQHILGSVASA